MNQCDEDKVVSFIIFTTFTRFIHLLTFILLLLKLEFYYYRK